jgi:carbamoyl-phosphate synthase large subunit
MSEITVFVTGVGGGGHGAQILKALHMADTGYSIIGADISLHSKGLYEVDRGYLLPPATDAGYIEALVEICTKHAVKALFHGSEPELKAMSANRELIEAEGILLPINPQHVIDTCMDKVKLSEFLRSRGFHPIGFRRVASIRDLEVVDDFPVVLKPSVGSGGSANAFLAQNKEELIALGSYLLSIFPQFIVQDYIGTPDNEYTVGILTSMDGELMGSIAVKRSIMSSLSNRLRVKNRTGKRELGDVLALSSGISQGEIGPFPEVTQHCEEIAKALGARGPLNIQCRLVDGEVKVFEINPRFSGTTSLRAMVGFNEPDLLIRRHVMQQTIQLPIEYQSGMIIRGLSELLIDPSRAPGMLS